MMVKAENEENQISILISTFMSMSQSTKKMLQEFVTMSNKDDVPQLSISLPQCISLAQTSQYHSLE